MNDEHVIRANEDAAGSEGPLAMAERHVREAEARIARQEEIIAEMDRDDHPHAAEMGRKLLATLRETRDLMREHLESLRDGAGKARNV